MAEISPARRAAARQALALEDDALLQACEVDVFVGGGPGGQHRNKTATAIRLTHPPTAVTVTATERRSQSQNRAAALGRLRERLLGLAHTPKARRPTKPSRGAKARRVDEKKRTGAKKAARRPDKGWD